MENENYDSILSLEKDNWWYRGKRNLFSHILRKLRRKFDNCLDMGCGVGSNFEILKTFSKQVTGIDNSIKAISYSKEKNYDRLIKMDATDLKFENNHFDLVLCSDVLEHIDDKKAINEIARILKPEGILIFSVPAHNYFWGPTDVISKHLRRYEKKELKSVLNKKFDILKLNYWNFMMFLPNLLFIKLLLILHKANKPKNTLQIIPESLNKFLYNLLLIENKLFLNLNAVQGVSIVGVCKKRNL